MYYECVYICKIVCVYVCMYVRVCFGIELDVYVTKVRIDSENIYENNRRNIKYGVDILQHSKGYSQYRKQYDRIVIRHKTINIRIIGVLILFYVAKNIARLFAVHSWKSQGSLFRNEAKVRCIKGELVLIIFSKSRSGVLNIFKKP